MDGCGLLLEVMVFSLESSLFLFFLRHGYPFLSLSLFFGVVLLWHAIFSLFGATIVFLYFISGMFYEGYHQDMEHLLMWNGWMVLPILSVGM